MPPPAERTYVWVVTDERYSGCDEMNCTCSGILGEIFAVEQTARQYADVQGGQAHRREVLTSLPSWIREGRRATRSERRAARKAGRQ